MCSSKKIFKKTISREIVNVLTLSRNKNGGRGADDEPDQNDHHGAEEVIQHHALVQQFDVPVEEDKKPEYATEFGHQEDGQQAQEDQIAFQQVFAICVANARHDQQRRNSTDQSFDQIDFS